MACFTAAVSEVTIRKALGAAAPESDDQDQDFVGQRGLSTWRHLFWVTAAEEKPGEHSTKQTLGNFLSEHTFQIKFTARGITLLVILPLWTLSWEPEACLQARMQGFVAFGQ